MSYPFEWQKYVQSKQLEMAVTTYVRDNEWTIFSDFVADFAPYFETTGPYNLRYAKNILLWPGMSKDLVQAISAVVARKEIFLYPINPSVYRIAGVEVPTLPQVAFNRQMANPPYEVWCPVALRLAPPPKKVKK